MKLPQKITYLSDSIESEAVEISNSVGSYDRTLTSTPEPLGGGWTDNFDFGDFG